MISRNAILGQRAETSNESRTASILCVAPMCSLCGTLLGSYHWTDRAASPQVFAPELSPTLVGERQYRTQVLNAILGYYGLSVSDWAASRYVLKSKTGRTVLLNNLSELWPAAEALTGRQCNPLDPDFLNSLEGTSSSTRA